MYVKMKKNTQYEICVRIRKEISNMMCAKIPKTRCENKNTLKPMDE